jgi:zinc/manganese transport system substrate-binding protein
MKRFGIHILVLALLLLPRVEAERLQVLVLHPLLAEMTQRIAGDAVDVSCLLPQNANLHGFDPSPGQMAQAQGADLVVAMGKHLEPYLDRLRENMAPGADVYEAGRLVPSVRIDPENEIFACCPVHSHGAIDPHWWHSPMAMRRAVRHLGRKLEELLPAHQEDLRENTRAFMAELEDLHHWAEKTLSVIPRSDRKLVTAHAAFGYFCTEYGFIAVPVKGLTAERNPSPAFLKETLETLRRERVRAVFPEGGVPDAVLDALRESTGVQVARHVHADFMPKHGETYADMFRSNVTRIVEGLGPEPAP